MWLGRAVETLSVPVGRRSGLSVTLYDANSSLVFCYTLQGLDMSFHPDPIMWRVYSTRPCLVDVY